MSTWRAYLLAALIVFLAVPAAPAGPRQHDVWYEFVHQDVRYGYTHLTVTKLANGHFRYVTQSRLLIELLGVREEITSDAEYVVTPTYEPVSATWEGKQSSGETGGSGRARDGKLEITFVHAGVKQTRSIDLKRRPVFEVCLDDWLNDRPPDVETAEVNLISGDTWRIYHGTLTRKPGDAPGVTTWSYDFGMAGGRGSRVHDADGALLENKTVVPRLHLRRCSADDAKNIQHLKMQGRYILMFPIDPPIEDPSRLTDLTVKLTWKDIPFERLELTDSRQHVVSKSEKDGRFETIVRIEAPPAVTSQPAYPIKGPEFARYLAETDFIRPQHERIIATARKAVEGQKTPLAAVQAITAWVFKNIESAVIAETLTGPEALETRKGKCSEFATLFASLARSIGIPTRIVLGERMFAGHYGGHMWNEAYVGRWITVDATANEVGASFALLKLIHSDTVLGTQEVRWGLTDSLDIAIEEAKMKPSSLTGMYKTGIEGRVYTNVDYACRFTAPADWTIEDASKPGVTMIRFKVPDADHEVLVHLVPFSVPEGTEPKAVIQARLNVIKTMLKGFELLEDKPCEVNSIPGHTIQFNRMSKKKQGMKRKTTEVIWRQGTSCFLLNIIADVSAHDKHTASFRKLLASYEHLEAK